MSLDACAEIVRRGDPDRFLASMTAPVAARERLLPLYAFNVEVARAPWLTAEPMIAEMRLQWWRDVLDEIARGGPVRRHEVATPLAQVLDPEGAILLDSLVAARRWDCTRAPFADQATFEAHIDACFGTLMWVAARVLGAATGERALRDLAFAQGIAAWLLAVPDLEARGRLPLVDGRPAAVAALARQGLARLAAARRQRAAIPPAATPAALTAWRAGAILGRAAADPTRVADGRLAPSEFHRRAGLLIRSLTGRW
ncbi:squalene/phytoene synthase family protein [Rhodovulum tesquicola]|uniref:squalene/phytoene synthase family protein n=1 Tax=Rhodovulum tesquicola TaxID=540254 RepID=UPI0020981C7B|nr:squalene/phytoene synthase family protein [Rhodovulum tesquicola]MCO8144275.1 squalene/phytoene synthase family protein [Rhodovulum tesquicola]